MDDRATEREPVAAGAAARTRPDLGKFADLGEDTGWNMSDDLVAESDRDA